MMHCRFNINSLDRMLSKMADDVAEIDIDGAVVEALDEIGDTMLTDMQEAVARHRKEGRAYRAVKKLPVDSAGNYHQVEVGAMDIRKGDQDGFHVIYQEYGSPTFPADPWLRPAMERMKKYKDKILQGKIKLKAVGNVK